MFRFLLLPILLSGLPGTLLSLAQDSTALIDAEDASKQWSFNNGAEFPGATGSLGIDAKAIREGKPTLKLLGDFTRGGGYVQAGRTLDKIEIHELSMWIRSPGIEQFTLRINDSSGQTHQLNLKVNPNSDWQRIELPLERFFKRRGQTDAFTGVGKYEYWGGAKDGNWHGPATAIYLLLGNDGANKVKTLWINDISVPSPPVPVAGAEIKTVVQLDELADWKFSDGQEFKGAKGSLTSVNGEHLKLAGDFTAGGAYVAAIRSLDDLQTDEIRFRVRSKNTKTVSIQLVDSSGQTHQHKGFPLIADGHWHDVVVRTAEIAGGEHWGGANDGRWHDGIRQFVISVTSSSDSDKKQPTLEISNTRAEVLLPVFAKPAAFSNSFDSKTLGKKWIVSGGIGIKFGSLRLTRTLDDLAKPCRARSPDFPAIPGRWEIRLRCRPELHSPDNSYNAVIELECLDSAGSRLEGLPVADVFGKEDWQDVRKLMELPKGTARARFVIQLNKTYGSFAVDDIAAAYLAPSKRQDDRISRMLFSTAQLGNLLFPGDHRQVKVIVEARKPLRDTQMEVGYIIRDYWGAEQTKSGKAALTATGDSGGQFRYEASIDLTGADLEIGRYYEVHASIPGSDELVAPFEDYTSLAILPEAVTRHYKPEEIPFTSRNWDNRISEYIRLTDRIGVRICGLWAGWSHEPPYSAHAPGLELCRELGMGWLSNTPIATIERGEEKYSEKALRQGVQNLIKTYGDERPLIINLGNEPHGTGERVLKNVAAYKAVYEEIKKIDPSIPVVATSVEPNEEYFKAGYGQWCDAFDFHIYETAPNVRRTMEEYGALMKKYDVKKPLWSTELGLNSQGQSRHIVAIEVFKKISTFFAAGGENVSWFGLLYPDPEGKLFGTSGDSHNVFNCRFNHYSPRLDAIAYYNVVNAISVKKFVEEKRYDDGTEAYLFRDHDGRSLQFLWRNKGRRDTFVPLPGVEAVEVIHIDGRRAKFDAAGEGITLSISNDPLLLLYKGDNELSKKMEEPRVSLAQPSKSPKRGQTTELTLTGAQGDKIIAPPYWSVERSGTIVTLTPPEGDSAVREIEIRVELAGARGELGLRIPVAE